MHQRLIRIGLTMALMGAMLSPGCSSLTWTGTHAGVRYSIQRDKRSHAIVKGKDGSLMYDSPELVVLCEQGQLMINGENCGTVSEGDLVEVTELGTVLVNGQRRGDKLTGQAEMKRRIEKQKSLMQTHSDSELEYQASHNLPK